MIRGQYDIVLAGFVALCLVFGGASQGGFLSNFALQVIAIGMISTGFALRTGPWAGGEEKLLRWCAYLIIAIAVLQFLPLPFGLWSALPGRSSIANGLQLIGADGGWMLYSLAPFDSLATMAWLLPAVATAFCASLLLDLKANRLAIIVVAIAIISIPLAALQVASEGASSWYFYRISSFGQGNGFFANGNHQATFLAMAIVLLSALYANHLKENRQTGMGVRLVFGAALVVLLAGVMLAGSLAGIGLLVLIAAPCVLIMTPHIALPSTRVLAAYGLGALVFVAIMASLGLALGSSALESSGPMSRIGISTQTLALAFSNLPFGSGLGTFEAMYRGAEDETAVTTTFINHAHNDYVELLLETGLLGGAAMVLFALWWVKRSLRIWTEDRDNHFALAGTIMIAVVLIHSVVDYPLRTVAVSALFALGFALMVRPASLWLRPNSHKAKADPGRRKKKKITF
ncbi:MAG: O-antigen ligase family protein [Pseudomonadota bacterium]